MFPKKLSLALRDDRPHGSVPLLQIPVSVFLNLIPEEQDHFQATRGKAGTLTIPLMVMPGVFSNFNPHISYGFPPVAVSPVLMTFAMIRETPAHFTFETGYGELTVRCEEFLPLVEHMAGVQVKGVKLDELPR